MEKSDYGKYYNELIEELTAKRERRTQIETELGDLTIEIDQLDKITDYLAALGGFGPMLANGLSELGITDAVEMVLSKNRQSVAEIKTKMEEGGFDFSKYSAPNSSISTILGRLIKAGKAEPEKEGWRMFYKTVEVKPPF